MKKTILLLSALLLLTSFCDSPPKVVNIQPIGKVSPKYIEQVKKSVKRFYGYECVVRPRKEVEEWMLSEKRRRIEAERTIRKYNTSENLMFITKRFQKSRIWNLWTGIEIRKYLHCLDIPIAKKRREKNSGTARKGRTA